MNDIDRLAAAILGVHNVVTEYKTAINARLKGLETAIDTKPAADAWHTLGREMLDQRNWLNGLHVDTLEGAAARPCAPQSDADTRNDKLPHAPPNPAQGRTDENTRWTMYGVPVGKVFAEWHRRWSDAPDAPDDPAKQRVVDEMLEIARGLSEWTVLW